MTETFEGVATLRVKPWTWAEVLAHFRSGRLIVAMPNGDWLGDWSVIKLAAEHVDGSGIRLTFRGEEVAFEPRDPAGFLLALEAEISSLLEMSTWSKLAGLMQIYLVRLIGLRGIVGSKDRPFDRRVDEHDFGVDVPLLQDFDAEADEQHDDEDIEKAIDPRLADAQKEVVEALRSAMDGWFAFYFLLGEGTDQARLHVAANELGAAAADLRRIADNLKEDPELNSGIDLTAQTYGSAVKEWAKALETIAYGAVLDQQQTADEGFVRLNAASAIAESAVDHEATSAERELLAEPLRFLSKLSPPARLERDIVEKAKQPWRRAVIAAGSPFSRQ